MKIRNEVHAASPRTSVMLRRGTTHNVDVHDIVSRTVLVLVAIGALLIFNAKGWMALWLYGACVAMVLGIVDHLTGTG